MPTPDTLGVPRHRPRSNDVTKRSPHFFAREADGSVRLRIRFGPEEATRMEIAAGSTPVMSWIHETLANAAEEAIKQKAEERNKRYEPPS